MLVKKCEQFNPTSYGYEHWTIFTWECYISHRYVLGVIWTTNCDIEKDVNNGFNKYTTTIQRMPPMFRLSKLTIFNAYVKSARFKQNLKILINRCLRIKCRIFRPNIINTGDLLNVANENPIRTQKKSIWIGHANKNGI